MPIGTEVDLDPGDTVLDGDPASPRGAQHPTILAHVLWPNGFVDQDTTWYRVGLGPGHSVTWGPSSPLKGAQQPPIFGPCLLWPNGRMDQDANW